jgi:hypothetical protein
MSQSRLFLAVLVMMVGCGSAAAQTAGVLYTWPGTGNIADWQSSGTNLTTLSNTTAGQLTVTEMGDELDSTIVGGPVVIQDGYNRRRDSSTDQGGLDLTGLDYLEIDVSHTGTSNVNVQFFVQATPAYNYLWYGPGPTYTASGPDWSVPPNVVTTLRLPVNQLSAAQQAWIPTYGLSIRDHAAAGNLIWNISEVRSVGAGLTVRNLATHDAGTSDNGLNGAFVNYGNAAVLGNDGGQNQTGLSQVTDAGVGSLQWTDKGNGGVGNPSGAAISWVNGTAYTQNNSYFERLADFSNYNQLTIRLKATDVTPGGGGTVGGQTFFQTGNYLNQVVLGNPALSIPVDGQYHDFVFSLASVTNLQNVQDFGLQLFGHTNDVVINVDNVQFSKVAGVPGDYNGNGVVDAADYVLWRKGGPLQNEVDTPGTVNGADYTAWRARFGNTSGSGSGSLAGSSAVPEPTALVLLTSVLASALVVRRGKV